eukprot:3464327-Rhodomonas_salina.1
MRHREPPTMIQVSLKRPMFPQEEAAYPVLTPGTWVGASNCSFVPRAHELTVGLSPGAPPFSVFNALKTPTLVPGVTRFLQHGTFPLPVHRGSAVGNHHKLNRACLKVPYEYSGTPKDRSRSHSTVFSGRVNRLSRSDWDSPSLKFSKAQSQCPLALSKGGTFPLGCQNSCSTREVAFLQGPSGTTHWQPPGPPNHDHFDFTDLQMLSASEYLGPAAWVGGQTFYYHCISLRF